MQNTMTITALSPTCTHTYAQWLLAQFTEKRVNGSMGRELQRQLRALQSRATSLVVTVPAAAPAPDPAFSRPSAPKVAVETAGQG
jgi:hypothetical protein